MLQSLACWPSCPCTSHLQRRHTIHVCWSHPKPLVWDPSKRTLYQSVSCTRSFAMSKWPIIRFPRFPSPWETFSCSKVLPRKTEKKRQPTAYQRPTAKNYNQLTSPSTPSGWIWEGYLHLLQQRWCAARLVRSKEGESWQVQCSHLKQRGLSKNWQDPSEMFAKPPKNSKCKDSEVRLRSEFLYDQMGFARVSAWQCGILCVTAGAPGDCCGYDWHEIYLCAKAAIYFPTLKRESLCLLECLNALSLGTQSCLLLFKHGLFALWFVCLAKLGLQDKSIYIWPNVVELERELCDVPLQHKAVMVGAWVCQKWRLGICRIFRDSVLAHAPFSSQSLSHVLMFVITKQMCIYVYAASCRHVHKKFLMSFLQNLEMA